MDKRDKKEKIMIKLICLLLSFGLWIYITNVENPIQRYTLKNVPVKIINSEKLKDYGLAIAPNQNFIVDLRLEGDAKNLYSVNKDQFELVADLEEYALKKGENNVPITIKDMPSNVNIKNDKPQTIKIMLESYETREFKVTSKVKVNFANGVYKDSITPTNQTVTISGPKSSVDEVTEVSMIGEINEVSNNTTKSFRLEPFDSEGNRVDGLDISDTQGTLNIKVSEGKIVNIDPNFVGEVPEGYSLTKSELSKSTTQIFGDNKVLEGISSIKTEKIDLSKVNSNIDKKVKLIIPDNIKSNETEVNIKLEVTKESPKSKVLEVPISYTGLKDELTLSNQAKSINVTIEGLEGDINKIGSGDLTAVIDLSSYNDAGKFTVEPTVKLTSENNNIVIKPTNKVEFELQNNSNNNTNVKSE